MDETPGKLKYLIRNLNEKQLDTQYREGGWTIRQVLHHLVDSHVNSYIRFKWTLTEDEPVIKAYYEERWAELNDSIEGPAGEFPAGTPGTKQDQSSRLCHQGRTLHPCPGR